MSINHTFIHKNGSKTKTLTPLKAIREKCLECCAWNEKEVRLCPSTDCVLHPFRMGKGHTGRKGKGFKKRATEL